MTQNEHAEHKLEILVCAISEKTHEFPVEEITIKPKDHSDTFSI